MASLWDELCWRGLVHQATATDVGERLDAGGMTAYIGFDPTADSLHVGSLLQLCTLRRLQQAGHRPIALAGGGTGMIGDPGGKSEERNLLTREQLEQNLAGIAPQLARFIDLGEGQGLVRDNGEWLWSVGLLEFLRDTGKHFTVNQMVAKDSVRSRIEGREQGISFTEFSYMLLQAYDFLRLFDEVGCTLQLGGSDQWGNITMGVDLVRKVRGATVYGLTSPLVLKADGTKFGKSETGTVWLDATRTSPYQLHQFLLGTEDAVVGGYLRYFTWLDRDEIGALDDVTVSNPEQRRAQRALAHEVTALVHGEDEARRAQQAGEALFGEAIATLDERSLLDALREAPSSALPAGTTLVDALAATGLVASKGEARRAVQQRGVYVNGRQQVEDRPLSADDALHGRYVVLRRGKKAQHLVVLQG